MKKLIVWLALLASFNAFAVPSPVIWGPGNVATVIPPVLKVGSIAMGGTSLVTSTQYSITTKSPITGTAAIAGTSAIVGTGTKFLTDLRVGMSVTIAGETKVINGVTTDTAATVTGSFTGTSSGNTITTTSSPDSFRNALLIWPNGAVQIGGTRTFISSLGASASNARLVLVQDVATAASASNPTAQLTVFTYSGNATGNSSILLGKARGNEAAPAVPNSGDVMGSVDFAGYDGGATYRGSGVRISGVAAETWSSTARGGKLLIQTVPNTTTTLTTAVTIDQDQSVTIAKDFIIATTASPASGAACTAGRIVWDTSYIYVCTASGAWKRAALTGGY